MDTVAGWLLACWQVGLEREHRSGWFDVIECSDDGGWLGYGGPPGVRRFGRRLRDRTAYLTDRPRRERGG